MQGFFITWWRAFALPVGWGNRVMLVVCMLSLAMVSWFDNWAQFWLLAGIWLPFTMQFLLNDVYRRGRDAGEVEVLKALGFNQLADAESIEQVTEVFEMHVNKRIVALHDLREICEKYDVPLEEMQPIVHRAFG